METMFSMLTDWKRILKNDLFANGSSSCFGWLIKRTVVGFERSLYSSMDD